MRLLLNFSGQKQRVDLCECVACSTGHGAISQYSKHEAFFVSDQKSQTLFVRLENAYTSLFFFPLKLNFPNSVWEGFFPSFLK